jgi:hypothetical protein
VTAQVLLVEGLDTGLADRRVGLVAGARVGRNLVSGDWTDVAEHLGSNVAAQRIGTSRDVEHRDARELRRVQFDELDDVRGRVGEDRRGLVRAVGLVGQVATNLIDAQSRE